MKKRIISLCLVVIMVLAMLPAMAGVAMAAGKKEPKRLIGVVFDNSGSMYITYPKAWCQAIYAMEVFASMLNKDEETGVTDEMRIYPMGKIAVTYADGTTKEHSQENPLKISGPDNSQIIRSIETPDAPGTPISTIDAAYEDMKGEVADEKWLLVLTDGNNFHGTGDLDTKAALEGRFNEYCADMKIMYLGIADACRPEASDPEEQIYDVAPKSEDVPNKLTIMSNRIFGRNTLQKGDKIDVSLKKLIVFAQGAGNSSEFEGGEWQYTKDLRYSEKDETKDEGTPRRGEIDTSLVGSLSSYMNVPAGDYDLPEDLNKTAIYYEPDVDLQIRLVNDDGQTMNPDSVFYAGDYWIEYCMVDNQTKEPTTSSLLREIKYSVDYTINGSEPEDKEPPEDDRIKIELTKDAVLEATVKVTYLDGYTLERSLEDLGWDNGKINVVDRPIGTLELAVSGGSSEYPLSQLEELAVYDVTMTYDGEPVTENITLDRVELTGGNAVVSEPEKTADGYQVRIRYNGTAVDTQCGEYKLTLQGSYVNEDGNTATSQPKELPFTVTDDSTTMEAKFQLAQDYYVMSKIEEGQPIYFCISKDDRPLTPEEFEQVDVTEDLGELAYDIQADPAESRYVITLKKTEGLESGTYKISATAVGKDELGREITMHDEEILSIRPYPEWMVWLFWILVALVIVALIWTYMNSKVLPRQIDVDECSFTVKGKKINGDAECEFSGKGKKRGTLKIMSPTPDGDASARCGFVLDLVAVSPRRKRSSNRLAKVVSVMPAMNAGSTTLITIGGEDVRRDKATGKWLVDPELPDEPLDIILSSEDLTYVTAKVQDYERNTTKTVAMSVPVVFY